VIVRNIYQKERNQTCEINNTREKLNNVNACSFLGRSYLCFLHRSSLTSFTFQKRLIHIILGGLSPNSDRNKKIEIPITISDKKKGCSVLPNNPPNNGIGIELTMMSSYFSRENNNRGPSFVSCFFASYSFLLLMMVLNYHAEATPELSSLRRGTAELSQRRRRTSTNSLFALPDFTFEMMINQTMLEEHNNMFEIRLKQKTEEHILQSFGSNYDIQELNYKNIIIQQSTNNDETDNNSLIWMEAMFTNGHITIISSEEEVEDDDIIMISYNALSSSEEYWNLVHELCKDDILSSIQSLDIHFDTNIAINTSRNDSKGNQEEAMLILNIDDDTSSMISSSSKSGAGANNNNNNSIIGSEKNMVQIFIVCISVLCSTMLLLVMFITFQSYSSSWRRKKKKKKKIEIKERCTLYSGNTVEYLDDDDYISNDLITDNDLSVIYNLPVMYNLDNANNNKKKQHKKKKSRSRSHHHRQRSSSTSSLGIITEDEDEGEENGSDQEDGNNTTTTTVIMISHSSSDDDDDDNVVLSSSSPSPSNSSSSSSDTKKEESI